MSVYRVHHIRHDRKNDPALTEVSLLHMGCEDHQKGFGWPDVKKIIILNGMHDDQVPDALKFAKIFCGAINTAIDRGEI